MTDYSNVIENIAAHERITISQLATSLNKPATSLYDIQKGKVKRISARLADKICEVYPHYNKVWILTGSGPMLNDQQEAPPSSPLSVSDNNDYRLVPQINIDSIGGLHSDNAITDEPQYVVKMVPFVGAHDGDVCITESGESMSPTIPPGALLLLRNVPDWREYFGYGNIFVIVLKDGRRITKEVQRYSENPKEYVLCHSHNPNVQDEELPKSMILAVWKVVKVLIDKGY